MAVIKSSKNMKRKNLWIQKYKTSKKNSLYKTHYYYPHDLRMIHDQESLPDLKNYQFRFLSKTLFT
jgi:hypothetical protein